MDPLQTPLEDLLLRHSLTTATGSLWAWLAVLTAAVGLWRVRTVGSRSVAPPPTTATEAPAQPAAPPIEPPTPTAEGKGTPKARFTAYYSYEACSAGSGGEEEGNEEEAGESDRIGGDVDQGLAAPWKNEDWGWEGNGICVRRKWDLGWYRYQERTALNGSVVRFWDRDAALAATSPRGTRRLL